MSSSGPAQVTITAEHTPLVTSPIVNLRSLHPHASKQVQLGDIYIARECTARNSCKTGTGNAPSYDGRSPKTVNKLSSGKIYNQTESKSSELPNPITGTSSAVIAPPPHTGCIKTNKHTGMSIASTTLQDSTTIECLQPVKQTGMLGPISKEAHRSHNISVVSGLAQCPETNVNTPSPYTKVCPFPDTAVVTNPIIMNNVNNTCTDKNKVNDQEQMFVNKVVNNLLHKVEIKELSSPVHFTVTINDRSKVLTVASGDESQHMYVNPVFDTPLKNLSEKFDASPQFLKDMDEELEINELNISHIDVTDESENRTKIELPQRQEVNKKSSPPSLYQGCWETTKIYITA